MKSDKSATRPGECLWANDRVHATGFALQAAFFSSQWHGVLKAVWGDIAAIRGSSLRGSCWGWLDA
jgi:hypothetical protein